MRADKEALRERVWDLLERKGVARFPGAPGRIPNFAGAEVAAKLLASLDEWTAARRLKANPDAPQLPVRARALADGKTLFMAVPRLRERRPFLRLDGSRIARSPRSAASIGGAARLGRPVTAKQVPHLDLVVCGSVAVDGRGARVGKGGGFSDLEFALLVATGAVDESTMIATTVHPLQVVNERVPETAHDFRVDLIVTSDEAIRPRRSRRRRPVGILWDDLDDQKLSEVPVLAAMAGRAR